MISFLIAFFGGVLGTILAIIFGYVDFSDFSDYGWQFALRPLFRWPWILFPVVLTLSSMAWPFVVHTFEPSPRKRDEYWVVCFGFTSFVGVMLAFPAKEEMGIWANGSIGTVIICTGLVQYFVAFFASVGIEEFHRSKAFYKAPSRFRKMFGQSNGVERGPTYRELPTSQWPTKDGLVVGGSLGPVEFECDESVSWDSWRTLEIDGDLGVCKGSSITTRHSLFVGGALDIQGGGISSDHVITLKRGGHIFKGDLKARHLISGGSLSIDGDLTVSGSVFCEGEIKCTGRVSVGGIIEAFAVCSPDPDRVRSENTLGSSTRVELIDQ